MSVKSSLISNIPKLVHGFGNLSQPLPVEFESQWGTNKPEFKQVHGIESCNVHSPKQSCGNVDALYSKEIEIPIAIKTADCVPILLARKDGETVAAVHAGWKGTKARILEELWRKLESQGEKSSDWVAAIGPAIGPCCYEVSEELADDFEKSFVGFDSKTIVPRYRILDLPAINAAILEKLGFKEVEIIRACTRCSTDTKDAQLKKPLFHSYRREGAAFRQWSGIMKTRSLQ